MNQYYKLSDQLVDWYGEKVYKLPINQRGSCPNRVNNKRCTFCAESAQSSNLLSEELSIKEQIQKNKDKISKKYGASRFIAYFQNYSATYRPLDELMEMVGEAVADDIVEICLSTRPDCVPDEVLKALDTFSKENGINITIELGLQSVNPQTLINIQRGHDVACYVDAVKRIKEHGFIVGTHLIGNLPGDSIEDIIRASKLVSQFPIDRVKLHSLFIAKHSELAKAYLNKEFEIIHEEEYLNRCVAFIEHLHPKIAIERFFSRANENDAYFCNWSRSWRYLQNKLDRRLLEEKIFQGDKYV